MNEPVPPLPAPLELSARKLDRSQHKLLIVNDDPVGRYATVRQLRAAGFPTVEAGTGMEALALADETISAVILDIHLPDIDGLEVCRRLRRQPNTFKLPVIHLTSAYLTDEDKVRGLDSGADAYLTHPVEPAVIISTIQALVRTRAAEDAMRSSEAKFRAAFERAPGGIGLVRLGSAEFVDLNPALLALLGRTQADVADRPLLDFVAPADAGQASDFVAALANGDAQAVFQVAQPNGRLVSVEWTSARFPEPGVAMVVATDVSQRLWLAEQRQAILERERSARGTAEHHSRIKDDLIALLSHELRTPLNVIVNWSHILHKHEKSEIVQRGLDAIERNAGIQARLISDILDMSRLNLGKLPLNLEWIKVGTIVAETITAMQPMLDRGKQVLGVDVENDEATIYADGARIQQVLWNLIGNAIKFSPPESEITLTVRSVDAGVAFTVADQGKGIAPEFLPFVFDRFAQSDAASNRAHGGLGLGLAIVKNLVESHGGHVSVTSSGLEKGAQFSFWLPYESAASRVNDNPASGVGELAGATAAPLVGLRVLVVEDDLEAASILTMILGEQGMQVQHEASVDDALASLHANKFDLLISDIGMPGRDGYDLIRELRQAEGSGPHLPAIALSAFSRDADRTQALNAGFDVYLGKPLRPALLQTQILRLIGKGG